MSGGQGQGDPYMVIGAGNAGWEGMGFKHVHVWSLVDPYPVYRLTRLKILPTHGTLPVLKIPVS